MHGKLEDRLRRLEGRLELTQAQMLVLREQLRQVEKASGGPLPQAGRVRLLRLHGDEAPAGGPQAQRITTDAGGRVRLVSAESPATEPAPLPATPRPRRRARALR